MNELISTPEAAEILKVSRQYVHTLYRLGELPAVMVIGTHKRPRPLFSRQYVNKLAQARLAQAAA